jgi:hypothetical protein
MVGLAAVIVSIAVCGCSASQLSSAAGRPHGQPSLGHIPKLTNAQNITLPLDAYRSTPQQRVTLLTATDMLIRDCMRRFGFNWTVQARPILLEPGRRYGISNDAEVKIYGYHLPPERQGGSQPRPGTFTPPSAAEETVLLGKGQSSYRGQQIPEGGCIAEAGRLLGLDVNKDNELVDAGSIVQRLDNQANDATRSDTRLLEVFAKWSQCMHRAGYEYRSPWDANNDPAWSGETPSARETATALADLKCRNEANVAGVSLAVETAYQNQLIEQNAETLRQERAKLDERIRKGADIVAGKR